MNNVLITGIPRSGTTLVCHLLNQVPDVVALSEPMDVIGFSQLPEDEIIRSIRGFLDSNRHSLLTRGAAISKHLGGMVPDNPCAPVEEQGTLRRSRLEHGEICFDKPLSGEFTLAVKHNAAFTALLKILHPHFACFGIIRNPFSALLSWNSVDMPVSDGHSPVGEALDPALKQGLEQIPGRMERQLYLLHWFYTKIKEGVPRDRTIKYEEVIATSGKCLRRIVPEAVSLGQPLKENSNTAMHDRSRMEEFAQKLLAAEGAWLEWYSRKEIETRIHTAFEDDRAANRHGLVGPSELWQQRRQFQLDFLTRAGLQPGHFVLDFGCGTLRGGIPLIAYLNEGHYTGIEIREQVLTEGRMELVEAGLVSKHPHLVCAEDVSGLELNQKFDFIWAFSVLIHLDNKVLDGLLHLVRRHLNRTGIFYANVLLGDGPDGHWREFPLVERSMEFYDNIFAKFGLMAEDMGPLVRFGHVNKEGNKAVEDRQRMLKITFH